MLWGLIIVVFIFIEFIAFFEDTEERKTKREGRDWKRLMGREYE